MTVDEARQMLGEDDTFTLFANGFDEAFIGLGRRNHQWIAIYSEPLALGILVGQISELEPETSWDDAWDTAREYFEFNVVGAYVGEGTPLWLDYDGELIFQ